MSSVLGVVLLLGLVMGGMAVVVTVGATALDDTRDGLDTARAEKALTQFDSRSAMVALGGTSRQGVDLAANGGDGSGYGVDDDAGWMNVTLYNETADDRTELTNVTLGAFVYENGNDDIAYQGGGVWQRTGDGVRMLSPPEFHFRGATLTLPVITVDGAASVGANARVTKGEPTRIRYPNASEDANFTNPMDDGHVNVTVHSEYYEAWGDYFSQRTDGNVTYNHTRETARVQLVVPFDESYDNVVATTQPGGITVNGNDPKPTPHETGVNYPSADENVKDEISECENNATACDTTTAWSSIALSDTYYKDSSYNGNLVVDTTDGDVTLVVDGDFAPSSVTFTGGNNVTVYVRGNVDGSNIDHAGDPGQFRVMMHSTGEFDMNGNSEFHGLVYAPRSKCDMNGNAYIVGGAVCESMDINGNPNDFQYHSSVEDISFDLGNNYTPITYLHVTVNPVNVTSG